MTKWITKKLGEIGEIITGSTPQTNKDTYWNGEYNFYSPADFSEDVYCYNTERTVSELGLNTGRVIPENSIMVACIASIGKLAINKTKGITNQQINTIVPYSDIDYRFVYYLLLYYANSIKTKAAQTTIPIINKDDFSSLEFLVPESLAEQKRIASILSSADNVIATSEALIEKYKSIKQGMLTDLLTPKKGWKKVKFDDFFDFIPTNTLSRDCLNVQFGTYQNIHYGDVLIKYSSCLDCDLTEIPYINDGISFNKSEIKDGDVVFADTAEDDTVGKCTEVLNVGNRKVVAGLHTYLCRPKQKMALGYLGYFLNSNTFHDQLLRYIAGSKVSSVNKTSIKNTYIYYPEDLAEQRRIADILSCVDAKIAAEEKVVEKYKGVKKGLMERMMGSKNK